ncbi:MAG TPA: hypothetical protein VEH27_01385 [Methylomirabilota bacterium]|nr:hypothetical protein [Methylomirabilota bacterium]
MPQLDLTKLKVLPLSQRRSLTTVDEVLKSPENPPAPLPATTQDTIDEAAARIIEARKNDRAVILMYGAHLLRNGASLTLAQMMRREWLTHLATNGAGTIHDWEYSWFGKSTESVEQNVAAGTFGSWEETGRYIHTALHAGAVEGLGYGESLGKFIAENGAKLPAQSELRSRITTNPDHPFAGAWADLLCAQSRGDLPEGRVELEHRWKQASILAQAYLHKIPLTVHPGIGYDIISNHPLFHGGVIGRTAATDFRKFCGSVENLDGGVVLSVGSAIMAPQVFEKSLSCVHNLRFQAGRPSVSGHTIYVVDLQDGGGWNWRHGEPPKTNPAYYLRFCKSFSRMGGEMQYLQCDNFTFIHSLWHALQRTTAP